MGAQFTVPLITVIPGQLIASSIWNNEWNNLNTNFIPGGMDSYSDSDAQMQIQTAPYPGSVTSHASSLGGEIERIRYQIAQILGTTYWYNAAATNLTNVSAQLVPIGAVIDFPSATPPNSNFLLANGQAISRTTYASLFSLIGTNFGSGNGSTTFNIPNYTDRVSITAGNLYALAATGGATAQTPVDSGHTHTTVAHHHDMTHRHTTPVGDNAGVGTLLASLATWGQGSENISQSTYPPAGTLNIAPRDFLKTKINDTANTGDASPSTNSGTANIGSISVLPPYLGMYKLMRVI